MPDDAVGDALRKRRSLPDWLAPLLLLALSPFASCLGLAEARQLYDEIYFPFAVRDGQYGMAVMFDLGPWAVLLGIATALMLLTHRTQPRNTAWLGVITGSVVLAARLIAYASAKSALERSWALFLLPWALALLTWSVIARSRAVRAGGSR